MLVDESNKNRNIIKINTDLNNTHSDKHSKNKKHISNKNRYILVFWKKVSDVNIEKDNKSKKSDLKKN